MKKNIPFCLLLIILSNIASAQAPLAIPYQAVARTASGNLISNHLISVRFTIHDGNASGTVLYKEKHTPTTNALGLFSVNIGTGTIISGTMASINWGINLKFLQVELDTTGGNIFIDMGTTQMMSVPYALHAKTVEQNGGKAYLILTGDITNVEADSIIANNVGPNTQFVKVFSTTNLTTLNLTGCTDIVNIEIQSNLALTNITLPNTSTIHELFFIDDNPNLNSISLPFLKAIYGSFRVISCEHLTSINLGNLANINSSLEISSCQNLTTLDLSSLQSIKQGGHLDIHENANLSSINFSNLTTIIGNIDLTSLPLSTLNVNNLTSIISGGLYIALMPNLTTVNINNLTTLGNGGFGTLRVAHSNVSTVNMNSLTKLNSGGVEVYSNPNLTFFNLPGLTSISNNSYFSLDNNGFTTSVVNNLLAKFVSVPVFSNCSIRLDVQTPAAPPTGQGIVDKNTLISNGNAVNTD